MLISILFPCILIFDAFLVSMTYGANKIKIPKASVFIIAFTSTLFLAFSLLFASTLKLILPSFLCTFLSFLLFFCLGCFSLLHVFFHYKKEKYFSFEWNQIHFVIEIYFDELKADYDHSATLSPKEAFLLAIALSFDSLFSGFGIGLSTISIPILLLLTFIFHIIAIYFGLFLGKKISKIDHDFSWIIAITFFILAFISLFS